MVVVTIVVTTDSTIGLAGRDGHTIMTSSDGSDSQPNALYDVTEIRNVDGAVVLIVIRGDDPESHTCAAPLPSTQRTRQPTT
mgnify:CR=1 FL=1